MSLSQRQPAPLPSSLRDRPAEGHADFEPVGEPAHAVGENSVNHRNKKDVRFEGPETASGK